MGTVTEKGHRAEHELGPSILRAAEGEQNLPGVGGGAESVGATVPPDRKLSPGVGADGL